MTGIMNLRGDEDQSVEALIEQINYLKARRTELQENNNDLLMRARKAEAALEKVSNSTPFDPAALKRLFRERYNPEMVVSVYQFGGITDIMIDRLVDDGYLPNSAAPQNGQMLWIYSFRLTGLKML